MNLDFDLDGVKIAAQRWGSESGKKILALHGWLDNSASFSILKDSLSEFDIVALDLAGHGLSAHRQGRGAYNIWQDIVDVVDIAERLQWRQFALLGHSRGAMISTLMAGAFPNLVSKLVVLDALLPMPLDEVELPGQLANYVKTALAVDTSYRKIFPSYEAAVAARQRGMFTLDRALAERLAERGVSQGDGGYYWHHDSKLMWPSEIKLSQSQLQCWIDAVRCPALVFRASRGIMQDQDTSEMLGGRDNFRVVEVDAEHHLHFSLDSEVTSLIADEIRHFI